VIVQIDDLLMFRYFLKQSADDAVDVPDMFWRWRYLQIYSVVWWRCRRAAGSTEICSRASAYFSSGKPLIRRVLVGIMVILFAGLCLIDSHWFYVLLHHVELLSWRWWQALISVHRRFMVYNELDLLAWFCVTYLCLIISFSFRPLYHVSLISWKWRYALIIPARRCLKITFLTA
jgi:hypothetical protein